MSAVEEEVSFDAGIFYWPPNARAQLRRVRSERGDPSAQRWGVSWSALLERNLPPQLGWVVDTWYFAWGSAEHPLDVRDAGS